MDNDGDGEIDWPDDSQCTCALDPSETRELPPVPELHTFALIGVGMITLALIVRRFGL
jgi:hypothetical protein